jgi:hypothetical protein
MTGCVVSSRSSVSTRCQKAAVGVRVAVDRPARQRELQVLQLVVQIVAARLEEIAVVQSDGPGAGQAGLRGPQRIEAGQLAWAVRGLVERGEQARQVDVGRGWVTAGDRVPERDWVAVYHHGLVDLVEDADRRDLAGG